MLVVETCLKHLSRVSVGGREIRMPNHTLAVLPSRMGIFFATVYRLIASLACCMLFMLSNQLRCGFAFQILEIQRLRLSLPGEFACCQMGMSESLAALVRMRTRNRLRIFSCGTILFGFYGLHAKLLDAKWQCVTSRDAHSESGLGSINDSRARCVCSRTRKRQSRCW